MDALKKYLDNPNNREKYPEIKAVYAATDAVKEKTFIMIYRNGEENVIGSGKSQDCCVSVMSPNDDASTIGGAVVSVLEEKTLGGLVTSCRIKRKTEGKRGFNSKTYSYFFIYVEVLYHG